MGIESHLQSRRQDGLSPSGADGAIVADIRTDKGNETTHPGGIRRGNNRCSRLHHHVTRSGALRNRSKRGIKGGRGTILAGGDLQPAEEKLVVRIIRDTASSHPV
jgi:hypothetical protein